MPSDKLLTLLTHLSGHERNRLRDFVKSPYFNHNEELTALYMYLHRHIPHAKPQDIQLQQGDFEKSIVWEALFSDQPYRDAHLRKLCSLLIQLTLRFCAFERFSEIEIAENVYTAHGVNDIALEKHFRGVVRKTEQHLEQHPIRNTDYHMYSFLLRTQQHRHSEKRGNRNNNLQYLKLADRHLDCYYLSKKLMHLCDALYYKRTFGTDVDLSTIPQLMNYIEKNGFDQYLAIKAYYLTFRMIESQGNDEAYHRLKDFWQEHFMRFNEQERRTLFVHLSNYCISNKVNMGETSFTKELFSLYRLGVEKKIVFENDRLPIRRFKNIVNAGLKNKQYKWVKNFIDENVQYLEEGERDEAHAYNLAKWYYEQQMYDKAQMMLRKVEFKKMAYAIGGNALMIRIYYENENNWQSLDSLLSSFRIYLLRNQQLSQHMKRQYLNALRFVKKLTRIIPGESEKVDKLINQIQECDNLAAKDWILQKANELR